MKPCQTKITACYLFAIASFSLPLHVFALSDAEKKSMQDELNRQVISRSFDPDNPADLQAYLDDAVQKGIKPPIEPSPHWQPGYTCDSILRYGYYGYRNCMLYYRYYGCYYC